MDIPLRAKISQDINNRFSKNPAALHAKAPAGKFIRETSHHVRKKGH
jgi:hypothetical protein